MTDLDYNDVLRHAKAGKKPDEILLSDIRIQLHTGAFRGDPYTLLHIIGLCGNVRTDKDIVLSYLKHGLDSPDDDGMVRRMALYVLAHVWSLRDVFEHAVQMIDDPSIYVKLVAATAIGHLGESYADLKKVAARVLLDGFNRNKDVDVDSWEAFHEGLLELFGVSVDERPRPTRDMNSDDIHWDIIAMANSLVTE